MKRTLGVLLCAALVMVSISGVAGAAQIITFVGTDNTTGQELSGTFKYGGSGMQMTLPFDPVTGRPNYSGTWGNAYSGNPAWISSFTFSSGFTAGSGGGGGTGGSGGGGGVGGSKVYDLVLNSGEKFSYTALFYDTGYLAANPTLQGSAEAFQVRVVNSSVGAAADAGWTSITIDQLVAGKYITWDVAGLAGDTIETQVRWSHDGSEIGAAGFFVDNVTDNPSNPIPEPATVGLVLFGLAGVFVRRRGERK
jgi:hypothetical protein